MLKISQEFFDKDLTFCYRYPQFKTFHCGTHSYHCHLDPKGETLSIDKNGSAAKGNTSLKDISSAVNALLVQGQTQLEPFFKSADKLAHFTQNIKRLDEKIQHHNDSIDQDWFTWIVHGVLRHISFGHVNWRIPRIDLKALDTLVATVQKHHTAAATLMKLAELKKIGVKFRSRCLDHKRLSIGGKMLRTARSKLKVQAATEMIRRHFVGYVNVDAAAAIPVPVLNNSLVNKLYPIDQCICGGGDGAVYRLKIPANREPRALKLSSYTNQYVDDDQQNVVAATSYMLQRGLTPHLTHVHETFKTSRHDEKYPHLLNKGYVMELLDGDLTKYYRQRKPVTDSERIEQKGYLIQMAFTEILLNNLFGVVYDDGDGFVVRNIFYKHLTADDRFQGKRSHRLSILEIYNRWTFVLYSQAKSSDKVG